MVTVVTSVPSVTFKNNNKHIMCVCVSLVLTDFRKRNHLDAQFPVRNPRRGRRALQLEMLLHRLVQLVQRDPGTNSVQFLWVARRT